ncbi:MAG: hypothetical protein ABIP49_00165, partial [Lysobacterales bacterium]
MLLLNKAAQLANFGLQLADPIQLLKRGAALLTLELLLHARHTLGQAQAPFLGGYRTGKNDNGGHQGRR